MNGNSHYEVIHCTCCHGEYKVKCVYMEESFAGEGYDSQDENGGPAWVFRHDRNRKDAERTAGLGMCGNCNADMCRCGEMQDLEEEFTGIAFRCAHTRCSQVDFWGDEQDLEAEMVPCEDHAGCQGFVCQGEPDWA